MSSVEKNTNSQCSSDSNSSSNNNSWHLPKEKKPKFDSEKNKKNAKNSVKKFNEVQLEHIKAAKKHIQNYESSSEEEDNDLEYDKLIQSVFREYNGDQNQLKKTQEFLENVFQSGTATCLICIATVKRSDYIWTCDNCYNFFHLNCLQRWAKDSISQQKLHQDNEIGGYYTNSGEYVPKRLKSIKWCCPKCRFEYDPDETPQHYYCFCNKEINPTNHAWLVPHSCGEICGKQLKSACTHKCVILCHPGPCPPCAQIITTSCKCGQSNVRTIRCAQNSWQCGKKCKQKLACNIHICDQLCHRPNECPPCMKKSQQPCVCGNKTRERDCNSLIWFCDKICNKLFECGRHRCKIKCHNGDCGECPNGLPRSCPCGKETTRAPCNVDIEPCGNTCQKLLICERHICAERCHKGDCGQCLEIIEKRCRCGSFSKEIPCSKVFTCEAKCKRMRDCGKHACNRKCCDGQCPPCDRVCGKILSCGKHKCTSLCHNGQCYPCNLSAQVKCRCGNTSMTVSCGREKKTKPPKCLLPCKISSKCHHTNPHNCHPNECPPCTQKCLLKNDVTGCEHLCQSRCHDAVKTQIVDKNFKPAGPWDIQTERYEIKKLPHPKCEIKVEVECIGGHERSMWPCWNTKPTSCGRICGRSLKCGLHVCELMCHDVEDKASTKSDASCAECLEDCKISRPEGCVHPCSKRCHLPPCIPCIIMTKTACHCGLNQIYYKCSEFNKDDDDPTKIAEDREKRLSCGNRCIKNYPCGHRCINVCHSGPCKDEELCRKKIKIYCECKNRKIESSCDKIRGGFTLNCDETCTIRKSEIIRAAEENERIKREKEMERNRLELEEFEKKFAKKKHKERKTKAVETQDNSHLIKWISAGVTVAILSFLIYFLFVSQSV